MLEDLHCLDPEVEKDIEMPFNIVFLFLDQGKSAEES
jgi:hypothetical protein